MSRVGLVPRMGVEEIPQEMVDIYLDRYDSFYRKNRNKKIEDLTTEDFLEYGALEKIYKQIPEDVKSEIVLPQMGTIVCGQTSGGLDNYLENRNNELNDGWKGKK